MSYPDEWSQEPFHHPRWEIVVRKSPDPSGDVLLARETAAGPRVLLADPMGHGVDAVPLRRVVCACVEASDAELEPAAFLEAVGRRFYDATYAPREVTTATAQLIQLGHDDGHLTVASAGHHPFFILRNGDVLGGRSSRDCRSA